MQAPRRKISSSRAQVETQEALTAQPRHPLTRHCYRRPCIYSHSTIYNTRCPLKTPSESVEPLHLASRNWVQVRLLGTKLCSIKVQLAAIQAQQCSSNFMASAVSHGVNYWQPRCIYSCSFAKKPCLILQELIQGLLKHQVFEAYIVLTSAFNNSNSHKAIQPAADRRHLLQWTPRAEHTNGVSYAEFPSSPGFRIARRSCSKFLASTGNQSSTQVNGSPNKKDLRLRAKELGPNQLLQL